MTVSVTASLTGHIVATGYVGDAERLRFGQVFHTSEADNRCPLGSSRVTGLRCCRCPLTSLSRMGRPERYVCSNGLHTAPKSRRHRRGRSHSYTGLPDDETVDNSLDKRLVGGIKFIHIGVGVIEAILGDDRIRK